MADAHIRELRKLENNLRLSLGDAAAERLSSRDLDLERQMKEVLYDVEDALEAWSIHRAAMRAAKINIPLLIDGYRLRQEISSIRDSRAETMSRMAEDYRVLMEVIQRHPAKVNQVPSVQLSKGAPPIQQNNNIEFAGFKDEEETLINRLLEKTEEPDVICITGMPGIGKTTLASRIYQNGKIAYEFSTRIWVQLPTDFTIKNLCISILERFIDVSNDIPERGGISDDQLIHAVRACLEKSKRFLIVMDDVWSADTLHIIRCFLPNTGKVLITSRDNHVTPKPHVLRFLNHEESWELLQLQVFGKLNDCHETLRSTGEIIAKNCDGSPLAISIVASRLIAVPFSAAKDLTEEGSNKVSVEDLTKEWWKKVSVNVTMYITEYGAQRNLFKRVELSYIKLPQYLRNCFLYLGVFPEGHEIPVWTLTRLWIAEGLVQVQDWSKVNVEEAAERDLYELVHRNLVMVGKIYPNGQIKTCRLHTLIYGFCKYKAAEQDFYHEVKMSRGGALDRPTPLTPNHRRLCIHSCLSEFLSSGPKGQCVRSILCLNKEDDKVLHPKHSSSIHKSFKLLKILECSCIKFVKFPKKLSRLVNLRYISLSCDDLDAIPKSISSLCYLETLVVDTQSPSFELKANIWRMLQLRHLLTKAAIVLSLRGNGEAGESEAHKNLQTLTRLAPQCCTEDVFTRAQNLKSLGIRGQLAHLSDAKPLTKLQGLKKLKLINESAAADSDHDHQLHRLLHPVCNFPPSLKRLTLSATNLEWKWMSVLGKIDSLEILKLKNNAFTGESWTTDEGGFHHLGFLLIGTTDLVSWEASADCFPALKCLVLKNCEKLHEIPPALVGSLDTLDVENVSKSVLEQVSQRSANIAME
ncbi:hypothetical protein C2S52_007884 [Perilla frutescens var. hirtella]|nr:hypothetical protein C2S52_007884 [Perilla frutescens var. hirtella]